MFVAASPTTNPIILIIIVLYNVAAATGRWHKCDQQQLYNECY